MNIKTHLRNLTCFICYFIFLSPHHKKRKDSTKGYKLWFIMDWGKMTSGSIISNRLLSYMINICSNMVNNIQTQLLEIVGMRTRFWIPQITKNYTFTYTQSGIKSTEALFINFRVRNQDRCNEAILCNK